MIDHDYMSVIYDLSVGVIRNLYDRRISAPPLLDLAMNFPDAARFVAMWPRLRDEALWVAENLQEVPRFHELMPQQAEISANDQRDWRVLVLKAYGIQVQRNMALCPMLASLVTSSPDVLSAALSFLAPHKHIPLHRGPFRGITRFYLGLSVPLADDHRPAAVLAIDGQEHRIGDGECLLWDDTYPHEVWNHSGEVRIALLLDVRRRGMPVDMELLSKLLIAAAGLLVRVKKRA